MVRHLTAAQHADEYTRPPTIDDRDPAAALSAAVAEVLTVAETWLGWDGRPIYRDGNAWTPHKALRRVADHMIDHLAEMECRLAGLPTVPNQWHGRMVTSAADLAQFTEIDLDEATSRIIRLDACYRARLTGLDSGALDARPAEATWTLREIVHHVAEINYYGQVIGDLSRR